MTSRSALQPVRQGPHGEGSHNARHVKDRHQTSPMTRRMQITRAPPDQAGGEECRRPCPHPQKFPAVEGVSSHEKHGRLVREHFFSEALLLFPGHHRFPVSCDKGDPRKNGARRSSPQAGDKKGQACILRPGGRKTT